MFETAGEPTPHKDGARRHCHVVPGLNVLPDRQGGGVDRFSRPAPDCGQPLRIRSPLPAFRAEVLRPRPRPTARRGPTRGAGGESAQILDSSGGARCRNTGQAGVHRAGLSTEYRTASTHGHTEAVAACGSPRCRLASHGGTAVHGAQAGGNQRHHEPNSTIDRLHACAVRCRQSTSMVDEAKRRRESC